jgi:hypothetical protein
MPSMTTLAIVLVILAVLTLGYSIARSFYR